MKTTMKLCLVILALCLIGCKFKSTEELRPKLKKTQYRLYLNKRYCENDSIRLKQVIVDSTAYSGPFTRDQYGWLYIGDFKKNDLTEIYLSINNKDTTFRINTSSIDSLTLLYDCNTHSFEFINLTGLGPCID